MNLVEYLFIAIGAVALAIGLVAVVRRVSAYYRRQYNFSIWSGVLLLVFAVISLVFGYTRNMMIPLAILAAVLLLVTALLDIRLAGIGMGLLALLLQIVLAMSFIAIVIIAIIYFIVRSIRRGNDLVLDAVTGTTSGFRNGVQLFMRFFMPM